jgi:hypothetical protein
MAVPRLADYMKKQLAAGYDVNTIKDFLIKNNYNRDEVEEAANFVSKKEKQGIPLITVAAVILITIVIILGALFIIRGCEKEEEFVSIETRPPPAPAPAQEITAPPASEIQEILDEEEVTLEERGLCPDSCDDLDECTIDYCSKDTAYACVNQPVRPCCGNDVCEPGESYQVCPLDCTEEQPDLPTGDETISDVTFKARELAVTNPGKAENYCDNLKNPSYQDSCYNAVAEIAHDSRFCDMIFSGLKRNSCYVTAATTWQDYTVCEKITDEYLQLACSSLAESA